MPNDPVAAALELATTGPIDHKGFGRTDDVKMSVPGESFVVPADIVSALGDGNTAAGMELLKKVYPPSQKMASGGVPIVAAGGEYVIGPEHVRAIGGGSLSRGHRALDEFVRLMRKKAIKTLRTLPGPAKR